MTPEEKEIIKQNIDYFTKEENINRLIKQRGIFPSEALEDLNYNIIIAYAIKRTYQEVLTELEQINQNSKYKYLKIFFDQKGERPTYYTYLKCIVIGEENKGWQLKSFRVVFAKEGGSQKLTNGDKPSMDNSISENQKEGGSQKLLNDGTLLIDPAIVKIPKVWEIKYKNGYKQYPYIYITEYIQFYPDKY